MSYTALLVMAFLKSSCRSRASSSVTVSPAMSPDASLSPCFRICSEETAACTEEYDKSKHNSRSMASYVAVLEVHPAMELIERPCVHWTSV